MNQSFDLTQLVQVADDEVVAAEGEVAVEEAAPAVEEGTGEVAENAEVVAETTTEAAETVTEEAAATETVAALQTVVDANGLTLTIDKYAFEDNGLIFVPNAGALIKDGQVFLPYPSAVKDETSGNYFTDESMTTMISEVVVKDGIVYAVELTGKVLISPDDLVTQVPYT